MQYMVRKKSAPRVETLLGAECRFGLIPDPKGHSALQVALKNERKHVVRMLLHAITRTVGEQPYALRPFMSHRTEIAAKYPDLFLEFVKTVQLTREDRLLPQGNIVALLPSTTATLVAGSPERTPEALWLHVLEASD